ncbi:MAG: helix-turn-helix domain-containing protein [Prevotella sp.]|nr:helix-turn-helix domain-containing protein [Prevotella sp.]
MILARLIFVLTLLAMSVTSTSMPDSISGQKACPVVRIEAERLPDMNIARSGHSAFVVNGEVTVVGGHTSGFKLTPTAEYFKDGKWHLLQTVYPHDGGFSVVLQSGKVLVAGGFKDNLGIGQSYEVEMYDPVAHRFDGFGCLDQKRASAAALELDSGRVFITGNWYADDGMEVFDGQHRFNHLKPIRQPRYLPQLFRTSDGDVMMVGYQDNRGKPIDTLLIERMKGEAFRAPLFDTWRILLCEMPLHGDDSFIGDREKGDYAYLLPVRNKDGQVAIAEVRDTVFSLLPTDSQVPTTSQWGEVYYYSPFYADRPHQRGYVMGCDSTGRQYALCVDYAKKPAQLTLYHTDPLTETIALTIPVMTDDGNLMLTGIKPAINYNFNFTPTPQVWLLRFYDDASATSSASAWWCVLGIAVVLALLVAGLILWKRRRVESEGIPANSDTLLMQRITQLMEEKQRFKDPDLKISDVALELNTNVRYVSDCIKNVKGCSFTQYVNGYRIEHAQKLLREQPDLKISHIYLSSGFSNDSSFFRIFKSVTGTTPNEWKKQQND